MVRVLCPAKINLFLSVGPPDDRGYHPIRTVFQAVSLVDELTVSRAEKDSFECNLPLPERNTVMRMWGLLHETVFMPPLKVVLHKRIPSEAGLGGGSSDAAGLLLGVERLLGLRIAEAERRGLALAVGADVPFFLLGGRARGEGYGEILTPLPDPPETWAVIVKPEVGCPTGEMYRALDAKEFEWRNFSDSDEVYNDFERVAPCECLDLIDRLQDLGPSRAGLSGSGSAVFAVTPNEASAYELARKITLEGYVQVFVVKYLGRFANIVPSAA